MIDPLTAFSAVSAASSAISSAIQAGRDISSLSGPISKYAKAEAQLQVGAKRKKNSLFSKIGNVEGNAVDEFFKKEEVAETRAKLREMFMLYGKPGQWQRLQAEIARQRKMQMEAIEEEQKRQARNKAITIVVFLTIGVAVFGYYYITYLMSLT
tara:strand:- start:16902 stop:17363 length:462 start_codon:yes stop_codon:yes gene_type:complete